MDAAFSFFVAASVNQTFKRENDRELVAARELVKTVPKGRTLKASLQFHHLVKKRTSVLYGMSDRSGIRTYASDDTTPLTQRLRPLSHPACKINTSQLSFLFRAYIRSQERPWK